MGKGITARVNIIDVLQRYTMPRIGKYVTVRFGPDLGHILIRATPILAGFQSGTYISPMTQIGSSDLDPVFLK